MTVDHTGWLTLNCQQSRQQLFGNERLWQISKELLEQRSDVVDGSVFAKHNLASAVEVFS
jgi:hypothetical protein